MEQWAEIRRLHRTEQVPIKEIARQLGVARNTVRSALAADAPPQYSRAPRGSAVDAFEPQIRALLKDHPRMPATVIAQRIGWTRSITVLKDRVRVIRPEYRGLDPADRVIYEPGACSQWDLWFPDYRIPLGHNQLAILPVLVMTLAYSRFRAGLMIPSRQGGDMQSPDFFTRLKGDPRVTKQLPGKKLDGLFDLKFYFRNVDTIFKRVGV